MKLMKGVFIRPILQNAPTSQAMIETLKSNKNLAKRKISLKYLWTSGLECGPMVCRNMWLSHHESCTSYAYFACFFAFLLFQSGKGHIVTFKVFRRVKSNIYSRMIQDNTNSFCFKIYQPLYFMFSKVWERDRWGNRGRESLGISLFQN